MNKTKTTLSNGPYRILALDIKATRMRKQIAADSEAINKKPLFPTIGSVIENNTEVTRFFNFTEPSNFYM